MRKSFWKEFGRIFRLLMNGDEKVTRVFSVIYIITLAILLIVIDDWRARLLCEIIAVVIFIKLKLRKYF